MKTSEAIDQLAAALSIAQGQIKPASTDKKGGFKNKYASLASIWEVIREPLALNGLSILQTPAMTDGRLVLTTRILHKTGQWVEHELAIKPLKDDPQAVGSACTYARRYSLSALLGISSDEEDDDGEGAMGRRPGEDRQPRREPQFQQKATQEPPKVFNAQDPEQLAELEAAVLKAGISYRQDQQAIANELHGKPRSHYHTIIKKYAPKPNE